MGNSSFGAGAKWAAEQAAKRPNKLGLIYGIAGGIVVGVASLFTAQKIKKKKIKNT
ncbi:hypothetical protein [Zunongwangia profunda]|uniref:Uncharacterized protein n=1 Tax=Zunongwangia profunda (strain DSM 18752 / CCTCC AB 206139 / SM-A87) TaxID=655815 RepID=D5BEK1_ZUNPS|nr:hypothetical protein [Zunongwangia profunda]ADF54986.1 hypothetical protein ZPR_4686 [Zunongwangia profunda SM-A87]|tara:strand:+ start:2690 stop:2857 length:168 start_codon:yes stop_codon:yes gene_type:complete